MEQQKLKILIADDTITFRLLLKEMLRTLTYDISFFEASDGNDAVRLFNNEHPNIIILDLEMPKKTGLVAATEIRQTDRNVHIIVISGRINENVTAYLRGINITHVLSKPINPNSLRQIITSLVPQPAKKVNILIADDTKTMRDMLASLCVMKQLDISINTADDGEKALIEFRTVPFNMVFLDINMPKIDGITVLKTMKRLNSACKVIMITGDKTESTIRAAIDAGANGYVAKPFSLEQIQNSLRKLL